jgi:hypothetical protein
MGRHTVTRKVVGVFIAFSCAFITLKRKLIMSVGNRGNTLIDYAVGKGGDLSKWISAGVDFVFGVDVSRDNITIILTVRVRDI